MMNFKKYQKVKAMQSFRQKFNEMTKEYRGGFWRDIQFQKKTQEHPEPAFQENAEKDYHNNYQEAAIL